MTRRRWIADEASSDRAWLTGEPAWHLAQVLRAQPGQQFDVVAGDRVRRGTIVAVTPERVEFTLADDLSVFEMRPVALVLAIWKFDRMEWAIEKCTELGVNAILPIIASRTDAHLAKSAGKRVERWNRLVRQAAQQSRRSSVPEIKAPIPLKNILGTSGFRVVLTETEREAHLAGMMSQFGSAEEDKPVTLAVGPEGGWTENELHQFAGAGWISATLGPTILRAETAAVAATAIVFSSLRK